MSCEPENLSSEPTENKKIKLNLPKGVPALTSLYMYITDSCNLACRHCWITPKHQQGKENGQYLKVEYIQKAIQEAKSLGLKSVKLTGGEPTIHPKFKQIVEMINREKLQIIIETNGILLDENLASFLRQNNVSFISVSMDGANEKSHDWLRGVQGSYEKALNGILNLVKAGLYPQMICTLHKKNASEIEDIVSLAEKSGCGSVKFNHVQHVGRGKQFSEKYGLKVNEIIDIFNWIEEEIVPKSKIRIYFDIPFAFYPIRKLIKCSLSRCFVHNIMGILAGGEMAMCGIGVDIPELVYGHLESDSLQEVWNKSSKLKAIRDKIPYQMEGICRDCIHRDFCLGRCVADTYHRTKKLTSGYYFCTISDKMNLFPEKRKLYR